MKIDLERLKEDANAPETFINLLSQFDWKKSQNGYRAKQHGGHSIFRKNGVWLFTAHNGDYKGGDALTVTGEVYNLDLKTKDGLFEAAQIVCEAANLDFSKYCADAPNDPQKRLTPSVIETKAFLPNAGQPLSKSFDYEFATPESYTYKAAVKFYEHKTGAKQADLKASRVYPLQSITHIETGKKTVFNHKKIGIGYVPSGLTETIKVKIIDLDGKAKKQMFSVQNTGNYVFGLGSLPTENRKDFTLLLCAGEDDATAINANLQPFGYCAITFGSESATIPSDYLGYLQSQFKGVFCLLDSDKTGVKMAIRNATVNGLPYISIGDHYPPSVKDVCDIYKQFGVSKLLELCAIETRKKPISLNNTLKIKALEGEYLTDILKNNAVPSTIYYLNNTILIAPTGTGKSVFLSKLGFPKVIVCPTIALCRNYLKYGADIFTGDTKDEKQLIAESDFIVTTHANLGNLLKIIEPKNYFLCVDEAHNFTASASKNFMLNDLKRTLDLSTLFIGRCFVTGTDLYNFHSEFKAMKKIVVDVPKPKKQAVIVEAKSVIQTTIDKAKESIQGGRFPIILLNDKKEYLKQVTEGVKDLGFQVLNSDQKQTDFFKELTKTGNITEGVKGIITTSVIKEGNDIYNEFDFDFYVCNIKDAIFHSIEIEQLVNRARKAKSINVTIIKSKNRARIDDAFCPIECMNVIKNQTFARCNELNNTPIQYLPFEKNAQFHSNYAFVEANGKYELCELLLSYKVFETERRFELANDPYQRAQLEKYGFDFSDTETDTTAETKESKEVFKAEKERRKAQKSIDFDSAKAEILAAIESESFSIEAIDTASEGKAFAVECFERLTEIGVNESKVFDLVNTEGVTNDSDLEHLVKSVSLWQLRQDEKYMDLNGNKAIQIKCLIDNIKEGEKYATSQFKGIMRRVLSLEKGYSTRQFDKTATSHQVLDFVRLFCNIEKSHKTGQYEILGWTNFNDYIIENKIKIVHHNALKINKLV